jgi:protein-S-isoprenylcysteine O-methyltransferase Ste14
MKAIDIIITVGWLVFWVYWLLMATTAKAGRWTRLSGIRAGIFLVVLLLLRLRVIRGHGAAATSDPWLLGIGLAVWILGLALAVWARVYLGRNWGMPMSQKLETELVTGGPYAHARHPIYGGLMLSMLGSALAENLVWLLPFVLFTPYFIFSAQREEKLMLSQFPDAYREYRRHTKMLIPFVI